MALDLVALDLVAIWTPLALTGDIQASFVVLAIGCAVAGLVGALWIPRLPRARQIEEEPVVVEATVGRPQPSVNG